MSHFYTKEYFELVAESWQRREDPDRAPPPKKSGCRGIRGRFIWEPIPVDEEEMEEEGEEEGDEEESEETEDDQNEENEETEDEETKMKEKKSLNNVINSDELISKM